MRGIRLGSVGKLRGRPESEQFIRLTKTAKQAMLFLSSIQPDAGRRTAAAALIRQQMEQFKKKGRSKPDRVFRQSLVFSLVLCLSWGCATPPCKCPAQSRPESVPTDTLLMDSLREEHKSLEQSNAELAALVQAIRQTDEREIGLVAALGKRLARSSVLVTTLQSIDTLIEIAVKNVSNAQTVGYKRRTVAIEGGILRMTRHSPMQGKLRKTEGAYDLAIAGPGFFRVELPNGELRYTRNGMFMVNPNGDLVDSSGNVLLNGPSFGDDSVHTLVSEDGSVSYLRANGSMHSGPSIELTVFKHPEFLRTHSDTLFEETAASGECIAGTPGQYGMGIGIIKQGFLENSNVNLSQELLDLHSLLRWKKGIERAIMALNG
jgi:flagellar basal body rod protein FlgG